LFSDRYYICWLIQTLDIIRKYKLYWQIECWRDWFPAFKKIFIIILDIPFYKKPFRLLGYLW